MHFDRLRRSLGKLLRAVKELKEYDVAVLSPEETIDISLAADEFVFDVFGSIANFERWLIAERIKDKPSGR